MSKQQQLADAITSYLSGGALVNAELADHDAVRELLIDCRDELTRAEPLEAVPLLLWCPECGERHIDIGEFATKLHHTHACQYCGMVWRPAIVATTGVLFLPGFKNHATGPSPGETKPECLLSNTGRHSTELGQKNCAFCGAATVKAPCSHSKAKARAVNGCLDSTVCEDCGTTITAQNGKAD